MSRQGRSVPWVYGDGTSQQALPFHYSKWLCLSSCAFLIPALLSLGSTDVLWWLPCTYVATAAVSINYWRDAQSSWRRELDLVVAKLSFGITVYNGWLYTRNHYLLWLGWPLTLVIIFCYWLSITLHSRLDASWITAHMTMHLFISCGMSIVVVGARSEWQ